MTIHFYNLGIHYTNLNHAILVNKLALKLEVYLEIQVVP